ncbi:MAG: fluoride efflux transporter CrcB [Candidatus Marinimicrobia bacterium]|nr:fluoride efflux transporter CrcB [Candidatus Neomarinimicrobiota bacterium]
MKYLFIAMGGAMGAVLRFSISSLCYNVSNGGFPWGTLIVNVIGSFCLALFLGFSGEHSELRFFLAIGLLGAFTTFSAFSYETIFLFKSSAINLGILNIAANFGLSLVAIISGYFLSQNIR